MNNREEFEVIKGFGQRKWNYEKMENYLKDNSFFREKWAEEIGLHPDDDFERLIFTPYYMQLFQHGYAVGKNEQQKIIDECHRKIESQYNMIKSIQAYGEALQKTINELKAENPDVPCPVCGGRGWVGELPTLQDPAVPNDICFTCNGNKTVPLTKAQEYRIRELEGKIK